MGRTVGADLVDLVESGRIAPGRAVDIGCGTGATSIYLASHGFEVTGVDFAPAAIARAREAAADAEVTATVLVDDFTSPTAIPGEFDLLVDHGTFDDLDPATASANIHGDPHRRGTSHPLPLVLRMGRRSGGSAG